MKKFGAKLVTKKPEPNCGHYDQTDQSPAGKPQDYTKEHDTVTSRTTGRKYEISFGPVGGGMVPKNPFASLAQAGYLHSHPEILGKAGLDEWDAATKGKHLPKHVKGE